MARPIKKGLDYYPLDVDFLQDIKVRKIMRACGVQSIAILISLLASIYRDDGYYVGWDSDMSFLVADEVGTSEGAVLEVVTKAVQVNFFNQNIFEESKVLTSNGIQKRFFEIVKRRKSIDLISDYLLEDLVNVSNNLVNVNINWIDVDRSTQRKVKESKVKKSKEINVPANAEDEPSVQKNDAYRYLEDSTEYKAAIYLRNQILEFNPKCKVPGDSVEDIQAWADTIRLTFERDERTKGEMHEVIKYIFQEQGEFWRPNVQSPTSLRKNWDTIYGQMLQSRKTKTGKGKGAKVTSFNQVQSREWDFGEIEKLESERQKRMLEEAEGGAV